MANKKITELTATTTPASTDIVPIVIDPATTPLNRKVTLANLVNAILPAPSAIGGTTPAAGTFTALTVTDALDTSYDTVASHATTAPIWAAAGNVINYTGTATATNFPAAPRAGAQRILICVDACGFTHAGNITVQGGVTYTATAGDVVIITATTTTTFKVNILRQTQTGTGATVLASSPTLVSPALGTPASGILSNCDLTVPPAIGGTTPAAGTFTSIAGRSQTKTISSTPVTLTEAEMKNNRIFVTTGGAAIVLPPKAATLDGCGVYIEAIATVTPVIDPDSSDIIILDGTALTAGYKVAFDGVAGTAVLITYDATATRWRVRTVSGITSDGGA